MHAIDILVIALYMVLMVAVGWWVAKKASKNAESYFLADKSLPWWIIGIAHGSSGLDVTGTMWFVTMFFIYGLKAVWLVFIWPLFSAVFRMVYLGVWVRRSNVLTGAEWMRTRFGDSQGAKLAYLSVVVYALVHVVGFLAYAFQGIGKFTMAFFPPEWGPMMLDHLRAALPAGLAFLANAEPHYYYATIMMLVTGIYCVVGGMYSVVLNDVIQLFLKVLAAVIIAVVAIKLTTAQQIAAAVPAGWDNIWCGWNLNLDWSKLIPQLNDRLFGPNGDGYGLFGFFIAMLFLKGILVSAAGPTPNYAIQHVLSTRSPREAALENMLMSLVSVGPRFLLISGIVVLGIVFFSPELAKMGAKVDFEMVLPRVVYEYVPVGCRGLLIAALMAAFMSTFVSTANSGVAYIVNDVYRRYMNPKAEPRKLVKLGYLWTILVILVGIVFGFTAKSVTDITSWIVSALIPAFVVPNVLKWHWWRFNGWGFFAGMVAGTLAGILRPLALLVLGIMHSTGADHGAVATMLLKFTQIHQVFLFMLILAISGAASVIACLLSKPEDDDVLKSFYHSVRPWGFWKPIYEQCRAEDPAFVQNHDFLRDAFNVLIGIAWQTSLVALPMYLVIHQYGRMTIVLAIFLITSLILKFTWYDKLGPGEMYMPERKQQEKAAVT